ncbi:BLUF domain-containing protein [Nonlabens xiamenensis]|uniref:BLUF domain-containing protein n=1 Tax=Nonlabens xiamenensis TaxID=2341043 RepID=UPI000F6159CB|nr:BLUF domain-containing protein [Nonlabens xiamenensis]
MNILESGTFIEELKALSQLLGGSFQSYDKSAVMKLDNEKGYGEVKAYEFLPGFQLKVYDIELTEELRFIKDDPSHQPLYLLYSLKGQVEHQFQSEEETNLIKPMHNVILSTSESDKSEVTIPSDTPIKLSVIFIDQKQLQRTQQGESIRLAIKRITDELDEKASFKYIGDFTPETSVFATQLLNLKRNDIIGRLMLEANVYNIIASQLDDHLRNQDNPDQNESPLSKDELYEIINLYDYIRENLELEHTIKELALESGLTAKKLQIGFGYLYGSSVNNFVQYLRLERAKTLLIEDELSISEIVYEIGFSSKSYLSKLFRERYQMSPSDYRSQYKRKKLIFELNYTSRANKTMDEKAINEIVEKSRENNAKFGITGCLVYYQDSFYQILEGERRDILQLYDNILKDERHNQVSLLWKGDKSVRLFKDWSLGYISPTGSFRNKLIDYDLDLDVNELLSYDLTSSKSTKVFWLQIRRMIKAAKKEDKK